MTLLTDGPAEAPVTLVLAHGAGAPMDHPFMETVAQGLGSAGIRVVRFEFPYMAASRATQKRKAPDRLPKLETCFREVIAQVGGRVAIGGKSMGGRVAAGLAGESQVRGVLVFGYPFHPPGRPERLRLEPLAQPPVPVLVLQGDRDPFGTQEDVTGYALGAEVQVSWIPDGEHSLKPRKASGHTVESNLALAVSRGTDFLKGLPR